MILKRISFIVLFFVLTLAANSQDLTGNWKTIDDDSGEAKSIVNLYIENGKLYGKIIELVNGDPHKICDCSGDKAGQKIVGMTIIDGLKKDGKYWKKDKGIFDPEKDTYYDVRIWRDGNKLMVRGYIGFLFRTQTWLLAD